MLLARLMPLPATSVAPRRSAHPRTPRNGLGNIGGRTLAGSAPRPPVTSVAKRNDASTEPADQQYLDTAAGVDNGIDEVQEADERTTSQAAVSTPAATPVAGAAVPIIAEMPVAAATAAAEVAAAAVDSVGTSAPSNSNSSNAASSAARSAAPAAAATATAAAAPQASAGPTSHPIAVEEDFFGAQELAKELTDPNQFGRRGEAWVFAQLAAIALIIFPPIPLQGLIDFMGTLSLTAGCVFIVYALLSLGRNLSPLPQPRKKHTLVVSGMYSYVRHPMYSGLLLAGMGLAAVTHSEIRLALATLLWYVLEQKIQYEERELVVRYPQTYREYQAKVKKLIPFVY